MTQPRNLRVKKPVAIIHQSREEVLERAAWERGFFWGGVFAVVFLFAIRELLDAWLGL